MTTQQVIASCNLSLTDWRNSINQYSACGCREKWQQIKSDVSDDNAEKYRQFINRTTGNRDIHIIRCGHVWYGVK